MIIGPCAPTYEYTPAFVASGTSCTAPVYAEHRSRLSAGNTFFRSITQGPDENLISIECVTSPSGLVNVYFAGVLVNSYPVIFGAGSISNLRGLVASGPSSRIEMPVLNADVYDGRTVELDDGFGGLTTFPLTSLSGGSGGPTTSAGLALIRTGPERSLFILSTTEGGSGSDTTPPTSKRVQQWTGTEWVSYCNNSAGTCPGEGTC